MRCRAHKVVWSKKGPCGIPPQGPFFANAAGKHMQDYKKASERVQKTKQGGG